MNNEKTVWLLTKKGILGLDGNQIDNYPFQGMPVSRGDVNGDKIVVIVNKCEIWSYSNACWFKELAAETTLNCIKLGLDNRIIVGTANARVAWVNNGSLEFIDSFDNVPERKEWYTPWGGPPDVRSLAISKDGTIYANVHVGWIARSSDNGKSCKVLKDGLEKDVHHVAVHPLSASIVFAATAEGFYISYNHGVTFAKRNNGMPYFYQRACAAFINRDVYIASTSKGPHGHANALLFRSENEGKIWKMVNGLPGDLSKNIGTFHIAIAGGGKAYVVVEEKDLYETVDFGLNWKKVDHDFPEISSVLVIK